jgi:hypothetical protein
MNSKRIATSFMAALAGLALLGTVACKRSDTTNGSVSAPASQVPHDSERTVPGTRPGQAPEVPQSPSSH